MNGLTRQILCRVSPNHSCDLATSELFPSESDGQERISIDRDRVTRRQGFGNPRSLFDVKFAMPTIYGVPSSMPASASIIWRSSQAAFLAAGFLNK